MSVRHAMSRKSVFRGPQGEGGQAITEYILLLAAIVGFFVAVRSQLAQYDLATKFTNLLMTGGFAQAYQYGNPVAKGFEDGGPYEHPRAANSNGSTRFFYVRNP